MGSHPINLAFRFVLEISTLLSIGIWGWKSFEGYWQVALGIGIPIILMIIWGVFNVPADPSRSGNAPVVVPGIIRLLIEFSIFTFGVWSLYQVNINKLGLLLGLTVFIHYLISYDRVLWLLTEK